MFGGDGTNPLFPVSDDVRLPYNSIAGQPVPLDVLLSCNADMMNIVGDKNASSLVNLPMKLGRAGPVLGQHNKLPVTLRENICLDEAAGQGRSMMKQMPVFTGLRLSYGEEEHNSSISSSAGETSMANISSMLSHSDYLQNEIVRQNDELDRYIRIQEENIRKGIRELKHRHMISLTNALDRELSYKLHEKDAEIENLNRKNKELAVKIRQIGEEAQSWHYKAKQNESLVNVLRSNINQVVSQNAACLKEGCGASVVDDAVSSSSCLNQKKLLDPLASLGHLPLVKEEQPLKCKGCRGKVVSVLLLPCRHLCLCIECDGFVSVCPVCRVKKTGSLQVYMS